MFINLCWTIFNVIILCAIIVVIVSVIKRKK